MTTVSCEDEPRRTAVDGWSAFAKMGVAGSNPVVRSKLSPVDQRFLLTISSGRPSGLVHELDMAPVGGLVEGGQL